MYAAMVKVATSQVQMGTAIKVFERFQDVMLKRFPFTDTSKGMDNKGQNGKCIEKYCILRPEERNWKQYRLA